MSAPPRVTKGALKWAFDNALEYDDIDEVITHPDLVIPAHASFRADVKCYIKEGLAISYSKQSNIILKIERAEPLLERVGTSQPLYRKEGIPKAKGTGGGSRMPANYSEIVDLLRTRGYTVETAKGGHQVIKHNGKTIFSMASSPSDHRAVKNLVTDLKKMGIDLRR